MTVRLPPRLYTGVVRRVVDLNTLTIAFDLDFGVSALHTVRLEGSEAIRAPTTQRTDALTSLISMLGGKDVYVLSEPTSADIALGRVFLARPVRAPALCGVSCPPGLDTPLLEATAAMLYLRQFNFSKEALFALLNGHLEGAAL